MARLKAETACVRLDAFRQARAEKTEETMKAAAAAETAARVQKKLLETTRAAEETAERDLDTAQTALGDAEAALTLALRALAARDGAERRNELERRIT